MSPDRPTPIVYRIGEFELDFSAFELRRGSAVLDVRPKVLDVLQHLVEHHGRLVSKDELLNEVWRGVTSDANLSHTVMEARKALDDNGSRQSMIRTIRGRGYRFTGPVERSHIVA